jgi:hypothetical protein
MTLRFLILLIILCSSAPVCISQNTGKDDRLRDIITQQGQASLTIPYTDKKTVDLLTRNVSILNIKDNVIFISLSPLSVEWFLLQKYDYTILEKSVSKGIVTAMNTNLAMQWDSYPSYSQYDSIMRSFITRYPGLCRLDTIGTSINGKLVFALKISDHAAIDEDEPEVFYSSTIHGDETAGYVLMLRLADYLLTSYNSNGRVKNLVDNLQIFINPLANPDGTYRNGNVISSPIRYNANGIDLNRNFPDPITPNTLKQKETVDMMKFMIKHRFVISANFHTGSEVVNYPWDRWLAKLHADDSWFNSISRAYADTVHVYSGPAYMNDLENGVTRGAVWYIIYGGRQDYITYELQGREVTVELDNSYVTPAAQLSLLWQYNWRSLLGYLENALYGINGHVINAGTSAPVSAKVFIRGHDIDSSQVYSDTISGSFVRFLSPGLWNLTFSAHGFRDTTISNIAVYERQKTDLLVKMEKGVTGIDTTIPPVLLLYPNPASSELKVLLSDKLAGHVNVRIYNQMGILLSDYDAESVPEVPLLININGLGEGIYLAVFTNKLTRTSGRGRFVVVK